MLFVRSFVGIDPGECSIADDGISGMRRNKKRK